jgi:hypothetical protein
MESFVIRPMTWPVLRLFSRNPLIRTSDRIEAAVGALALLLVVVTAVCAGVIGTMIHDAQTQNYLEQAPTRHVLIAEAVDDSTPTGSADSTATTVHARWQVNGMNHFDAIASQGAVKAVAPLQIWVDGAGNLVDRPTPVARADRDAWTAALVGWLIVAVALAHVVATVHAHVKRMQNAQWDREIRSLVEDDGGRRNSSQ